ncbi:Pumilio y domain member 6, partial [Cryomyces antarcticus]
TLELEADFSCSDAEVRDLVIPEFYGHVRRLINHPEASWILDDIYRGIATASQKAILLREWYGAEFAIFKVDEKVAHVATLSDIFAQTPEKRKPIMQYLLQLINQLIQKKLTGFTMLHDAMLQYLLNTKPGTEEATEFLELLKGDEEGDLLKNMAFTKSGSRVACLALAYGSAKDRKNILRVYKDNVETLAYDKYGHLVLLTALDVIDDTVLTSKAIFPDLLGDAKAPET